MTTIPAIAVATPAARARRAFTMIELLTVIGIIVILMAILLPVVARVRQQAYVANTQNQIGQIAGAIERYKGETGYYPGPLPNSAFSTGGVGPAGITMTENVVLGLCGGWEPGNTYQETYVGQGAMSHNPNASKRRRLISFIDPTPGSMMPNKAGAVWSTNGKTGLTDSQVPEFMDRFPEGRPLVILRANIGAPGTFLSASSTPLPQYCHEWLAPYIPLSDFSTTDFPSRNGASPGGPSYFIHPSIPNTVKGKDQFIIICAGPDNKFGTKDDLTNLGSP